MKGFWFVLAVLLTSPAAAQTVIRGVLLGSPPPGLEAVLDAMNAKLAPLGARLELSSIGWNEVNTKYPSLLASGSADWVYTASWAPYTTQAVRGAFQELTADVLKANMPRHWAATPAEAWEQAKVGGRIFMIPTATPDRKVPVAMIRGDLRKRYGLARVTNVRDLEPYLAAVKKNDPSLTPINLGNGYDIGQPFFALLNNDIPPVAAPFFGTVYGNYEDPAHGLVNLLDEPWKTAYKKAAATMKLWYDRGYLNRAPFANTVLSKQSFAAGRSAVGFGNSQDIQEFLAAAQARGFDPEIIPILSSTGHSNADSYTGNGVAVVAGSAHQALTLQVLDLLMEDPSFARLAALGVEGKDWKLVGGKVVQVSNDYPLEAAGFWFVNKNLLPPLAAWPPAYEEHRSQLAHWLVPNTFLNFAFVPTKVKNEVAAITTIMAQYGDVLAIGAVTSIDKAVETLAAKLQAANQPRAIAELRAQLAAYR